jgi:hypothetical protein
MKTLKLSLYLLLFSCSSYAADSQKNYTLVIGSNRATETDESDFIKKLWHDEHALLDYRDRPDIITMDIQQAVNPGHHIIGDAATLDLSQMGTAGITTLYFERPWTFEKRLEEKDQRMALEANPVAKQLKHLLSSIPSVKKVVVEWHPFVVRLVHYKGNEQELVEYQELLSLRKANPFTGFFDAQLSLAATFLALNRENISELYSPSFLEEAKKLVPSIQKCINFYASKGFKKNSINKKLILETEIMQLIYKNTNEIDSFTIAAHPSIEIDSFNRSVDHIGLIKKDDTITYHKLISKQKPVKKAESYTIIPANAVALGTLYYFLWSDITVEMNKDAAIGAMKDLGLTNVTLQRAGGESKRENVWLLSGERQ